MSDISADPRAGQADGAIDRVRSLGLADTALGSLLWTQAMRAQTPLSIKEISDGRYAMVNEPMAALLGRPANELTGLVDADLMSSAQWPALRSAEQAVAAQRDSVVSEHRLDLAGGRREYSVLRMPLPNADGSAPRYLAALWTDLTATRQRESLLKQAMEQLEVQQRANEVLRRQGDDAGLRDETTGLYEQSYFGDLLRREIDLSAREHREFALTLVVLDPPADGLPRSAEAQGRVLEALGRQLRNNTRAMDASCRLGEERFAVLLSGVGLATAHARMEGLRRQCAAQLVVLEGRDLGFSVSMGVASFPHTADEHEPLVTAAETALVEAQRRGGNHVALASIRFEPS